MKKITGNGAELEKVLGGIGKNRKSFTLPNPCNLAKLVKNYLGLTLQRSETNRKLRTNCGPGFIDDVLLIKRV